MRQFRNNNKRPRYRSNGDKNYKRNGQNSSFIEGQNFQRRSPGRNNQNANKLIEKYSDLAREALSNGDKILSENYFQHADHFLRISNDKDKNFVKETNGINKFSNNEESSQNEKILEPTNVEKKII
tara:strand:+ start:79 stop:456 length:378 start_codon:yes stop_codon:yes gene_type:complete